MCVHYLHDVCFGDFAFRAGHTHTHTHTHAKPPPHTYTHTHTHTYTMISLDVLISVCGVCVCVCVCVCGTCKDLHPGTISRCVFIRCHLTGDVRQVGTSPDVFTSPINFLSHFEHVMIYSTAYWGKNLARTVDLKKKDCAPYRG